MAEIQTLRATLAQDAARRMLAPEGAKGRVLRALRGDIRALAPLYIPFRLYRVFVDDRGATSSRYYAVDAAAGLLDPYEFSSLPDMELTNTRNALAVTVSEEITRAHAIEKLRRKLYSTGFFRLRNPLITAELKVEHCHIPFWAGFFGAEDDIKIMVVDAVRHTIEGGKLRRVIQDWLMHQPRPGA
jgi:hypothetical protein